MKEALAASGGSRSTWGWLIGAALLGAGVTFLVVARAASSQQTLIAPVPATSGAVSPPCDYTITRVSGYRSVQPVLFSEPMCESPRFEGMRIAIATLVDRLRSEGKLNSASVYVRDFQKAEWTWYNGDELFDPGTMEKLPLLLSWLSRVTEDPSLMQRTWTCTPEEAAVAQSRSVHSEQVQVGRVYSTEQLLELMIVHADNRATAMLHHHIEPERFAKTFLDLGLAAPETNTMAHRMNVRDFSVFMKALYNSSYLNPSRSEYALDLMTRSVFGQGLAAGLPAGTAIAHKFTEAGDPEEAQLHETGLVYMEGYPYLITVMTRGARSEPLASAISSISLLVYERMKPA